VSRTYWRSLGELDQSAESRAFLEREFPEGASEPAEGITRREMISLLGASMSLAGLAGCDIVRRPVENIVPYVSAPEDIVPGIPRYYATTMPFGRSSYGLIVESHEGRPTKIEGNPAHPSTLGASSSRIQASVLGLYDPDRSQVVRLKGEQKSWADFVAAWAELSKAHVADGGAGLAILSPSPIPRRLSRGSRPNFARAFRKRRGQRMKRSATRTGWRASRPPAGAIST
jgi:MoCo/4Fe-4S cofactor protein with predicted Tat translocation signal